MDNNRYTYTNSIPNPIHKKDLLKLIKEMKDIKIAVKISMHWIGMEIIKNYLNNDIENSLSKSVIFGIPIVINNDVKYNMAIIEFNNGDKKEIKIFDESQTFIL